MLDTFYVLTGVLSAVPFHLSPRCNEIPHTSQAPAKLAKEQNFPVGESEKKGRKASESCKEGNRHFPLLIHVPTDVPHT